MAPACHRMHVADRDRGGYRRIRIEYPTRRECISEERRLKAEEPDLRRVRCKHSLPLAPTEPLDPPSS